SPAVKTRARKRSPCGAASTRRTRSISQASTPIPAITASSSARGAAVAGVRVTRRRLHLLMGLAAFGEEVPLVHRVIDEVPRQQLARIVGAMHEAVRVDHVVPST